MRANCGISLLTLPFLLSVGTSIAPAQERVQVGVPQTQEEKQALINRVLDLQKKTEQNADIYERIERVEIRKNPSDPQPLTLKVTRVVPAGTGVDHVNLGPDGKPTDAEAYRAELVKLEKALVWACEEGSAQRDAYARFARKRKERDELIDAARTAFVFSFLGREPRADHMLLKYAMEPNPAFKPNSRATSIFTRVRGTVWIDEASSELARIEGEIIGDISVGLFLAKVYKGSHFMMERYEFAPGVWFPSFTQYDFDGRKFFVGFSLHERTFYTNYKFIGSPKQAVNTIRTELAGDGLSKSGGPTADP
jgi:hypothetical protein